MRRILVLVAAAAVLGGCGSDGPSVVRGDPAVRHGEEPIADYVAIEEVRAALTAASDLYYSGGRATDARDLVQTAREKYGALEKRVERADPILAREIEVAFGRGERVLARGATPDGVRDTLDPLTDQLFDGVLQELVPRAARQDPGVQADVMTKLLQRIDVLRSTGLAQLFAQEWGYLRRAQALHVALAEDLGPQKARVTAGFDRLREKSFPQGALRPGDDAETDSPAPVVDRIRAAVEERFGLVAL